MGGVMAEERGFSPKDEHCGGGGGCTTPSVLETAELYTFLGGYKRQMMEGVNSSLIYWYIVRTFVNATMYPHTTIFLKRKKIVHFFFM
jgi:hypothetical protein